MGAGVADDGLPSPGIESSAFGRLGAHRSRVPLPKTARRAPGHRVLMLLGPVIGTNRVTPGVGPAKPLRRSSRIPGS